MSDSIHASMALGRFAEATSYNEAIRNLRFRLDSAPDVGFTPEQWAHRIALTKVMVAMLEKSRDELIELGILEWTQAKGDKNG